jgi:hypothetical protein
MLRISRAGREPEPEVESHAPVRLSVSPGGKALGVR